MLMTQDINEGVLANRWFQNRWHTSLISAFRRLGQDCVVRIILNYRGRLCLKQFSSFECNIPHSQSQMSGHLVPAGVTVLGYPGISVTSRSLWTAAELRGDIWF